MFDGSGSALNYFQLFYSDYVFAEIVRLTNLNAQVKRGANPDQHKGVWYDVTMQEMKAYYGMLLLMGVMKFDRDELYWSQSDKHWSISSKFGEIMPRDRFVQIKRYLHFSDDTVANPQQQHKLHKLRFILDHCRQAFQAEYMPHKQG